MKITIEEAKEAVETAENYRTAEVAKALLLNTAFCINCIHFNFSWEVADDHDRCLLKNQRIVYGSICDKWGPKNYHDEPFNNKRYKSWYKNLTKMKIMKINDS